MDYQQIKVEDREEVRLLVLARPEKLKSWPVVFAEAI